MDVFRFCFGFVFGLKIIHNREKRNSWFHFLSVFCVTPFPQGADLMLHVLLTLNLPKKWLFLLSSAIIFASLAAFWVSKLPHNIFADYAFFQIHNEVCARF